MLSDFKTLADNLFQKKFEEEDWESGEDTTKRLYTLSNRELELYIESIEDALLIKFKEIDDILYEKK